MKAGLCRARIRLGESGSGASRPGGWRFGGSEAGDEDSGLPAGELVPVGCVREWLGEHRSGDDDVVGGGVWSDGPVAASAGEDLFEEVSDLVLKRGDLVVVDDGAAVEREDELVAGRDRLVEELRECRGGRLVAQRGGARVLQDEVKGAPASAPLGGRGASGSGGRGFRSRRPPRRRSLPSALARRRA